EMPVYGRVSLQLHYNDSFFSSRRRHTRWPRDWSSDVCSSDLGAGHSEEVVAKALEDWGKPVFVASKVSPSHFAYDDLLRSARKRSEERRVGKECRFWMSREQ